MEWVLQYASATLLEMVPVLERRKRGFVHTAISLALYEKIKSDQNNAENADHLHAWGTDGHRSVAFKYQVRGTALCTPCNADSSACTWVALAR